ncbi:dentin sialophosphoprotein-like [Homarus americanus]|uniref:Cysteine-rich, acidic integral membrane protein-like 1 n=1 Tax=Homarus americanus TaxID=6706 RepID=A0A8J5MUX2_HOMAM|nr:dentin sialophosphoprotein-like [Homarus americanus]KAG7163909.1 Cysteine-rich, acidic integral membrane protein-like 1 [Homarus americanus]
MVMVVVWLTVVWLAGMAGTLPLDHSESRGFVGFSLFPPPPHVNPVECVTTNSLLTVGTCYNSRSCKQVGGAASGKCATGGVCCVLPAVCGGTITQNRTWFVNKDFPDKSRDSGECVLTIKKSDKSIKQARLDFESLELAGPRNGRCVGDAMTISRPTTGGRRMVQLAPPLCGNNSRQHVYVDLEDGEVEVRVVLNSNGLSREASPQRQWRVLITQLNQKQAAPHGCLQYHREASSEVHSLNYGGDFRDDLNYDICFSKLGRSLKTDESCNRKFTNVDFDQNPSYRYRSELVKKRTNKIKKSQRVRRAAEVREIGNQGSPIQFIPGKEQANDAFSDVISLVSKTVEEVRTETDQREAASNESHSSIALPLFQPFTDTHSTNNTQQDVTIVKIESSDQSPAETSEEVENMATASGPGVLPILYSEGNEAVISQIQRVVQQLQQQQLGLGATNNGQDLNIYSDRFVSPFAVDSLTADADEVVVGGGTSNDEARIERNVTKPETTEEPFSDSSNDLGGLHTSNSLSVTTEAAIPVTDNITIEGIWVETVISPDGSVVLPLDVAPVTDSDRDPSTSPNDSQLTSNDGGSATSEGSETSKVTATSDIGLGTSEDQGTNDKNPVTSNEGSAAFVEGTTSDDVSPTTIDEGLTLSDESVTTPTEDGLPTSGEDLTTSYESPTTLREDITTFERPTTSMENPIISGVDLTTSYDMLTTSTEENPTASPEVLTTTNEPTTTLSNNKDILELKETTIRDDSMNYDEDMSNVEVMLEIMKDQFLADYIVKDALPPTDMDFVASEGDGSDALGGTSGEIIMVGGSSGATDQVVQVGPDTDPLGTDLYAGDSGVTGASNTTDDSGVITDSSTTSVPSVTTDTSMTSDSSVTTDSSMTSESRVTTDSIMTSESRVTTDSSTSDSSLTTDLGVATDSSMTSDSSVTTDSSTSDSSVATDSSMTSAVSDTNSGSAQVELTLVDPERVQVHGNLVIIDHSSNDSSNVDDTDTLAGGQGAGEVVEEMDDLKNNDDFETGLLGTTESTTAMKGDPSEGFGQVIPIGTAQGSEENPASDGIQWLILEKGAAAEDVVSSSSPLLPPEIIVTSGIGFGSEIMDADISGPSEGTTLTEAINIRDSEFVNTSADAPVDDSTVAITIDNSETNITVNVNTDIGSSVTDNSEDGIIKDNSASSDTGVDSSALDTGADSSALNTGVDSSAPNTGVDSSALDTGVDSSAPDTGVDSSALDTDVDSSALDTGVDSSALDTGVDSSALDTDVDSSALDTGVDSSALDTGVDSSALDTDTSTAVH